MRKFRNFRTAIFIIGILGVFMTFLISIAFKEKFYIEETSWNGNEKSTKSILLKENQVVEEEIVASHEMLYCFYIIIDESYKNFPEESLLNIKLCDKQNAVLFEYNFPLQMIDSNEHYIPNICSQQLVEKEVYTVILSPVNFGDAQIEVRAGDEGNLLLGTTYQVTDTSQLSIVRSIILICCIFLFVASILFQLLCKNVEKIRTIYDKKKKYILPLGLLIFLTVILLIYDGLLAAGILSGLLASGYCFGKWLEKYIFRIENSRWVTLALGIGGIGCIVYFVFEFGVGHSWVVGLILACPIFLNIKELKNFKWKMVGEKIADKINKNKGYAIWLCICLAIAVIFALSPIDDADAYWKHLPITIYASNNGQWYHNIIENVVAYSESTLLSYCFSVIFSIFGVVKGYVLFNVFLFGAIYFSLLQVLRGIYPKVRKGIFSAIFMTTPLFVMLGTSYMVDCLPVFFVSAILLNIVSLDWQTILDRLPQIAFICGLCVFSKLTILSTLCIFIIIIAGLVLKWLICEKISNVKKFQRVTVTMGKCIICFAIPFIYAFVNNYYRTGNPFSITAYNNIFKVLIHISILFLDHLQMRSFRWLL